MEEKAYDVEMIYIQSPAAGEYAIELIGRHQNTLKLNFKGAEGIEFNAHSAVEIKSTFLQMSETQSKVWNMRLGYPVNLKIRFTGRVIIESM
jgi:hypothetical protein